MCFFSVNGELTIAKFDYRVVFQRLVWMGIHLVDPYQKNLQVVSMFENFD